VDSSVIRDALAPLQGLPLWCAGRASTMLWLQFGARVSAPTRRDPTRVTGEFALHLQCPWRIWGSDGIVTGSGDMFVCADPDVPVSSFDPGRPGNAVADVRLRDWIGSYARHPLVVVVADADRFGGFHLVLSEGFGFEAFPNSTGRTKDTEHWRLLRPGDDSPHFVVSGCHAER